MSVAEIVTRDWHRGLVVETTRADAATAYTDTVIGPAARESLMQCLDIVCPAAEPRSAYGRRMRADAKRRADAASTFPQALQVISGPVYIQPSTPTILADSIPVEGVAPWAETIRRDGLSYTGTLGEYRDGTTTLPALDYVTGTSYQNVLAFGGQTSVSWGQQNAAASPDYRIDPAAQKLQAAIRQANLWAEQVLVNGGGSALENLSNIEVASRQTATNIAGSSNVQDVVAEILGFADRVRETSQQAFMVDTLDISDRILIRIGAEVTTSAGYPFPPLQTLMMGLAERGIRTVNRASSLQGSGGGALIDQMVFRFSGEGGLRQPVAMPFAPVRTAQVELSNVTYYITRRAGLYAAYSGSTAILNMAVTAS